MKIYQIDKFRLAHYKNFNPYTFEIKIRKRFSSYAIFFPENLREIDDEIVDKILLISVTVSVKRGEISIGVLNNHQDNFVDERRAFERENITCQLLSPLKCGPLVVRNFNTKSHSIFQIHRIDSRLVCSKDLKIKEELIVEKNVFSPQPDWHKYFGETTKSLKEKLRLEHFKNLKNAIVFEWIYGIKL